MPQTRTIPLDQMRYIENRAKAAIARAADARTPWVHVEADPADTWLGWRLSVGRNGAGSVRVDGMHAIDDVLDHLQGAGWVRVE